MFTHDVSDLTGYAGEAESPDNAVAQTAEFLNRTKVLALQARMTRTDGLTFEDPADQDTMISHW